MGQKIITFKQFSDVCGYQRQIEENTICQAVVLVENGKELTCLEEK